MRAPRPMQGSQHCRRRTIRPQSAHATRLAQRARPHTAPGVSEATQRLLPAPRLLALCSRATGTSPRWTALQPSWILRAPEVACLPSYRDSVRLTCTACVQVQAGAWHSVRHVLDHRWHRSQQPCSQGGQLWQPARGFASTFKLPKHFDRMKQKQKDQEVAPCSRPVSTGMCRCAAGSMRGSSAHRECICMQTKRVLSRPHALPGCAALQPVSRECTCMAPITSTGSLQAPHHLPHP